MEVANDRCGANPLNGASSTLTSQFELAWKRVQKGVREFLEEDGASIDEINYVLKRLAPIEPLVNLRLPSDGMSQAAHDLVLEQFQHLGQSYLLSLIWAYRELWAAGAADTKW